MTAWKIRDRQTHREAHPPFSAKHFIIYNPLSFISQLKKTDGYFTSCLI